MNEVAPQAIPTEILKSKAAINLYLVAVFALAVVVVVIPIASCLVALWHGALPAELWTGWNVCIGGLIALIGAQGTTNSGVR